MIRPRSMRARGLPPETPPGVSRCHRGTRSFNEGRGVTPGNALRRHHEHHRRPGGVPCPPTGSSTASSTIAPSVASSSHAARSMLRVSGVIKPSPLQSLAKMSMKLARGDDNMLLTIAQRACSTWLKCHNHFLRDTPTSGSSAGTESVDSSAHGAVRSGAILSK